MARDWEAIYAERTESAKARLATLAEVRSTQPEAKAATGPGAFAMTVHEPLHSMSRDPNKLMAEAQTLFHTNVWVGAAERALAGRFVRMDWHLEDEEGETVGPESPKPYQAVLGLLQRPNPDKTRRQLWSITFRHKGLAGNGIWVLDQRDLVAGTPLQVLYVNPARMTPMQNEGGVLLGWVLDHPDNQVLNRMGASPSREGIPLSKEEVIHFTLDEPDWGIWGIGIAESAARKLELDRLADNHSGGVFGSGGRLAGLIAPKEGVTVTDDHWLQFVRDWRNITADPDAAKRLQIAKMPLDFTRMTANTKELQLTEISEANRDAILGAWGVPLTQLGIPTPAGLNSGERGKYDEAALWETVKARAEPFREKVQVELLDRFAELGVKVKLVFEYPEFDDESPTYENAARAKVVPLTVDQRLEQVGKDPLDPEIYGTLGQAIYIDQTMVPIFGAAAAPSAPEPEGTTVDVTTEEETEVVEEAKADIRKPLLGLRQRTETTWEPRIRRVVDKVLREQQKYIAGRAEHIARKPSDVSSWWNEGRESRRFMAALDPLLVELASEVAQETRQKVPRAEGKADGWLEKVISAIRATVGQRILGINQTTRDKVQAAIETGVEQGLGPREIGQLISDSAAFDEYRAEMVSRTETMNVYNDAALRSYGELQVEMVEAIDGDEDAECAARNGKRYPIDEAMGIADHPNGTLDWVPVV